MPSYTVLQDECPVLEGSRLTRSHPFKPTLRLLCLCLALVPSSLASPWMEKTSVGEGEEVGIAIQPNVVQLGSYTSYKTLDRIPWDDGRRWKPEVAPYYVGTERSYRTMDKIKGKVGTALCTTTQLVRTISHFRPRPHGAEGTSAPAPSTVKSMLHTYQTTYANITNTQAPLSTWNEGMGQLVPGPQGSNKIPQSRLTEMIMRHVQYSSLSYCSQEAAQGMSDVSIPGVQGQGLLLGHFNIVRWYPVRDLLYYVAVNQKQQAVHLVFRGSVDKDNFRRDANGSAITPDPDLFPGAPQGARIHGGIHEAIRLLFDPLLHTHVGVVVQSVMERYPGYGLVVSGHSLGGGLAALAALVLVQSLPKHMILSGLYTYGQPILGNAIFSDWLGQLIRNERYVRVVSSNDIAPYFTYTGWRTDLSPERMKRHSKNIDEVYMPRWTQPVVQMCHGDDDPLCSEGSRCTARDWDHHSWYGGQWSGQNFCLLSHLPDPVDNQEPGDRAKGNSGPPVLPFNPLPMLIIR
ncbi:MAG: Alpha/Beta hydrolase protein [Piptocephalis tieghemiana]|nr:MAG: Alpha/Beta hydrolase protein [Piptocephalis tieghemiana]